MVLSLKFLFILFWLFCVMSSKSSVAFFCLQMSSFSLKKLCFLHGVLLALVEGNWAHIWKLTVSILFKSQLSMPSCLHTVTLWSILKSGRILLLLFSLFKLFQLFYVFCGFILFPISVQRNLWNLTGIALNL